MRKVFDIAVVGAGVAGLMFAALLCSGRHGRQLSLRVIDRAPRPEPPEQSLALRVSAIAAGSVHMLSEVGAWPDSLQARAGRYERMRVWDAAQTPESHAALTFDAAEFALPQLGFIVENVRMQAALLQVLEAHDVTVEFDTVLERLPQATLVVGADGARSMVRELAGIDVARRAYEQSALVTHLHAELPHRNTAWQRFLRTGPIALLPLADGRVSLVWSTDPTAAEAALGMSDDELGCKLTEASDHVLGRLRVAGPRGAFPLVAQHARQYVREGVALIGDAAHTVHPLAGQGANLGLQDAAALAAVIDAALEQGLHPGDLPVLRRFERRRKGANATMMHFLTGLNRLFATDSGLLAEMRTAGMQMFNRSGALRERAVRIALGMH